MTDCIRSSPPAAGRRRLQTIRRRTHHTTVHTRKCARVWRSAPASLVPRKDGAGRRGCGNLRGQGDLPGQTRPNHDRSDECFTCVPGLAMANADRVLRCPRRGSYVWGLKSRLPDDERFFSTATIRSIWAWGTSWGGLLAIAAGAAGAAAAFVATYINSPDWGSSVAQVLGLMGATFTAFVTAATITRQGPS